MGLSPLGLYFNNILTAPLTLILGDVMLTWIWKSKHEIVLVEKA